MRSRGWLLFAVVVTGCNRASTEPGPVVVISACPSAGPAPSQAAPQEPWGYGAVAPEELRKALVGTWDWSVERQDVLCDPGPCKSLEEKLTFFADGKAERWSRPDETPCTQKGTWNIVIEKLASYSWVPHDGARRRTSERTRLFAQFGASAEPSCKPKLEPFAVSFIVHMRSPDVIWLNPPGPADFRCLCKGKACAQCEAPEAQSPQVWSAVPASSK